MDVIQPVAKLLACGDYGVGALATVADVCSTIKSKCLDIANNGSMESNGGCNHIQSCTVNMYWNHSTLDYHRYHCAMCDKIVNISSSNTDTNSIMAAVSAVVASPTITGVANDHTRTNISTNRSIITFTLSTALRQFRRSLSHRYCKYMGFYLLGIFSTVSALSLLPWWLIDTISFNGDKFVDM